MTVTGTVPQATPAARLTPTVPRSDRVTAAAAAAAGTQPASGRLALAVEPESWHVVTVIRVRNHWPLNFKLAR